MPIRPKLMDMYKKLEKKMLFIEKVVRKQVNPERVFSSASN